jgi:hypothetical protein
LEAVVELRGVEAETEVLGTVDSLYSDPQVQVDMRQRDFHIVLMLVVVAAEPLKMIEATDPQDS